MLILRASVSIALISLSFAQSFGDFTNSTTFLDESSLVASVTSSRSSTLAATASNSIVITLVRNNVTSLGANTTAPGTITRTITPVKTLTLSVAPSSTLSFSNLTQNATTPVTETNAGVRCNEQLLSWSTSSVKWWDANVFGISKVITQTRTITEWESTQYNCTMNCGTICYAGPTTVSRSTTLSTAIVTTTSWTAPPFPVPSPNCTIPFTDCLSMQSSYFSAVSPWRPNMPSATSPLCSACISTTCTFAHAGMSLYFWPVTTSVSRDYCAWEPAGGAATGNNTLPAPTSPWTATTTGPYAVIDGITMYQGNVYLSLFEPNVVDNCYNKVTRKTPGHNIITMASYDLYSVRKYPHNLIPYPVNYADFNEPVPWSAYVGEWYCANNRPICSEVFPGEYSPVMNMPSQIRTLDENWASCGFDKWGIFDPPYALHSVGSFLPTVSATTTSVNSDPIATNTAQPGQSSGSNGPAPTSSFNNPNLPAQSQPPSPINEPGDSHDSPTSTARPGHSPALNPNPSPTAPVNNPPEDPSLPVVTVGPTVFPVDPSNGVVINPGTTLSSGGPPVIISSTAFQIGDGGLSIVAPPLNTQISIGDSPSLIPVGPGNSAVTVQPGGSIVVGDMTISSGGAPAVISSTTFTIGAGGLTVMAPPVNTQISFGSSPIIVPVGAGNAPITLNSGGSVVLGGTTLISGGPAVTMSGTTMTMGISGIVIIDPSGSSSTVAMPARNTFSPQTITIGSSSFIVIGGGVNLAPGTILRFGERPVTISGTTFSVGISGLVAISAGGTSTIPLSLPTQVLTVGNKVYTMYDGKMALGSGTTIAVGSSAVTIDGTIYSVDPTGLVVLSKEGGTTVAKTAGTNSMSGESTTTTSSITKPKSTVGAALKTRLDWILMVGCLMGVALRTALS